MRRFARGHYLVFALVVSVGWLDSGPAKADIFRWDNGELVSGTEGITPPPGVQLDHWDLHYAGLSNLDLSHANLERSDLTHAYLGRSILQHANLTAANFTKAVFRRCTGEDCWGGDFTNATLTDVNFTNASLSHSVFHGANLIGADLTNAELFFVEFDGADLNGAHITGALFVDNTRRGFSTEQLYSTANYKDKDLQRVWIRHHDLTGWDLSGQHLTDSRLSWNTLTDANLSGAIAIGTVLGASETARRDYSAIFKAYSLVSGGLRDAKSDLERKAAVERLGAFSSKFIDLAAKQPGDPIALTALRQAVQIVISTDSGALQAWKMNSSDFPTGSSDGSPARTVALVLRDHVRSDKLGPVIDRMRYGYRMEYEKCLSAALEKNPHHEVQALASLSLAQFLHDKLQMLRLVEDRPELAECYKIVFGKDDLPILERLGQAELTTRIETLLEQAASQYADVKFRSGKE